MCKLANDFNVPMRQCANVPIILGSLTAFAGSDALNASMGSLALRARGEFVSAPHVGMTSARRKYGGNCVSQLHLLNEYGKRILTCVVFVHIHNTSSGVYSITLSCLCIKGVQAQPSGMRQIGWLHFFSFSLISFGPRTTINAYGTFRAWLPCNYETGEPLSTNIYVNTWEEFEKLMLEGGEK